MPDEDFSDLIETCTQFLSWHGPIRAGRLLATVPPETVVDRYGEGGVVADLEREVAGLLGKPTAVFLPSGTMAQQSVLRVHADRLGRRTIVFHPACHVDQHEDRAYQRLHHLVGRPAGEANRLLTRKDLDAVAEPPAVLLLELPQRDLGGQQPSLEELQELLSWARGRGAMVHLDGARLWESAAGYGVPPATVAGLFDTVYVSFYKGLGALPGCCVAGPADVIAEVREWRKRHGGTLFGLWPNAASARTCLAQRLPRMPEYLRHARAIADAVGALPALRVIPDPPQTPMLHLLLPTTADGFRATARRLATDKGIWTWPRSAATADPAIQRVELSVGDATCALSPEQVRDILAEFTTR